MEAGFLVLALRQIESLLLSLQTSASRSAYRPQQRIEKKLVDRSPGHQRVPFGRHEAQKRDPARLMLGKRKKKLCLDCYISHWEGAASATRRLRPTSASGSTTARTRLMQQTR